MLSIDELPLEKGESDIVKTDLHQFASEPSDAITSCIHPRSGDDDALLMYTSGTTGRPKGVVLSHGNLLAGGHNVHLGHELLHSDRALCVLPLFHINGLCVTIFGPLVSGGSVVIPVRFSTSAFWDWIRQHRCTWFSVVPTQISYLLHAESSAAMQGLEHVRFGRSASAPLSPTVHEQFEACFKIPLVETMGLTETAAQICSNPMPPGARKSGSPGVAVGDEIRIVDQALAPVDADMVGEVLVRGPNVMQRYFENEVATRESLIEDGWLRTGDLGKLDEQGYLFITGRLKELIIKGGENIAPREIDDALYRHPDVVEAAAFAMPCDRYGQRVEAAVALCEDSRTDESELLIFCEKIVGNFKRPDRIHLEDELPKGPSGKIQRRLLAEQRLAAYRLPKAGCAVLEWHLPARHFRAIGIGSASVGPLKNSTLAHSETAVQKTAPWERSSADLTRFALP